MNYVYEKELYDVEQCWLLGVGEVFEIIVVQEYFKFLEGRKVIYFNLDDFDDLYIEYYESNEGR